MPFSSNVNPGLHAQRYPLGVLRQLWWHTPLYNEHSSISVKHYMHMQSFMTCNIGVTCRIFCSILPWFLFPHATRANFTCQYWRISSFVWACKKESTELVLLLFHWEKKTKACITQCNVMSLTLYRTLFISLRVMFSHFRQHVIPWE